MEEHVSLLRKQGLPIPPESTNATVAIRIESKVAVV